MTPPKAVQGPPLRGERAGRGGISTGAIMPLIIRPPVHPIKEERRRKKAAQRKKRRTPEFCWHKTQGTLLCYFFVFLPRSAVLPSVFRAGAPATRNLKEERDEKHEI